MRSGFSFHQTLVARWSCLVLGLALAWPAVGAGLASKSMPQDLTARAWTKNQGLPDNSVTAVLQTRDGYLWVGTARGLARFDGIRFHLGIPQAPLSHDLYVTALCEDAEGRLWVGTRANGLLCWDEGILKPIATDEVALVNITGLAADNDGNLWVSTPAGLIRWNQGKLTRLTTREGLPSDSVSSVYVARSGTVWITTRGGVCLYKKGIVQAATFQPQGQGRSPELLGVYEDQQRGLWAFGDTFLENLNEGKRFNYFRGGDTSSARIWSICEGRNGRLWVGTSGEGLYCFANGKFAPVSLREGRLPSDVRAICEDVEGNLWLGASDGGLVRIQARGTRLAEPSLGLPDHAPATCLAVGPDGKLWVGFEHGGVFCGTADHFEPVSGLESLNLVSSMTASRNGEIWIGAAGGLYEFKEGHLLRLTTAHGLADNQITALAVDPENMVWVGTRAGGLDRLAGTEILRFGVESGLDGGVVSAVLPGRNGGLWVGTQDGALFYGKNGRFKKMSFPGGDVPESVICALHEDGAGRLWVGSAGGGLSCWVDGRRTAWDEEHGLSDSGVLGIAGDDQGGLWLQTTRAIIRIPPVSISGMLSGQPIAHARRLFEFDPTPVGSPAEGWPRGIASPDGRLWFATSAGLVTCDPRGVDSAPPPPRVRIEDVLVNDRPARLAGVASKSGQASLGPLRLPSNLRSLDIQFTAASLSEPEKVRFQHRLDSIDSDWVDGGQERHIRYARLPYGNYRFIVKASHAEGLWAESQADFEFVVSTPFWRAWWALGLYGLATTGAFAGSVRWVSHRRWKKRLAQSRAQQAMEKERVRIAQDMHDEIGSKLTKISFLSERARLELQAQAPVAQKLDAIASTSREVLRSLDEIVWAVNPRNDSLERLADYLGQYASEYLQNTPVACEVRIPPQLPKLPLSAEVRHNLFLAFEESLTNALKHAEPTLVQIHMAVDSSQFQVVMQDNGKGFDAARTSAKPPARGGNGLKNLPQRLAAINGRYEIASRPGEGTTVTLTIALPGAPK